MYKLWANVRDNRGPWLASLEKVLPAVHLPKRNLKTHAQVRVLRCNRQTTATKVRLMPGKYRVHTRQHDYRSRGVVLLSRAQAAGTLDICQHSHGKRGLMATGQYSISRQSCKEPTGSIVIVAVRVGTPEPTNTDRIAPDSPRKVPNAP